jgi:hypothetical protein
MVFIQYSSSKANFFDMTLLLAKAFGFLELVGSLQPLVGVV